MEYWTYCDEISVRLFGLQSFHLFLYSHYSSLQYSITPKPGLAYLFAFRIPN